MGIITPAPGVLGGFSLLTAVEFICSVHLIVCMVIVASASSVTSVDYGGVRISGYMQCVNAAWFLAGMPLIIVGGVGAVFRVEFQLKVYLAYLVATFFVVLSWLGVVVMYGNACNAIKPKSGLYKKQALMVCQAGNGMVIFWMLVLVGVVAGSIYLVWSMLQYVKNRLLTELLRYQEPWENAAALADDWATIEAKDRYQSQLQQQAPIMSPYDLQQRYGTSQVVGGWFNDPLKVQNPADMAPPGTTTWHPQSYQGMRTA